MTRIIGFPRDYIQVIPNGVDTGRFRPLDTPNHESRRQFGLPPGGLVMGMVARFVPFKNHAGMFHALATMREAKIDVRLALAGDGPLCDKLKQLARQLGIATRVHFLGEVERVETLYRALDIVVSNSSHHEGMSNSVLEAMASGVPVLATRVAASAELLDEGNAGLLVPPRDTSALVAALRQLIDRPDLRRSLSRAGRQRVEQHYTLSSVVESYRRLYLELAGVSGTRSNHAFLGHLRDAANVLRSRLLTFTTPQANQLLGHPKL
jgi:glycosyltransferase involved in cell wall biosynthesis